MPFPRIFLSYSQADYREVAYLHKKLERAGFDVWWDQMILPGQDWTRQLQLDEAIERSNVFILCFSEKALAELNSGIDAYTFRTIINSQARKSRESFVIPIRLSECMIPPFIVDAIRPLVRIKSIDLFPHENHEIALERLLNLLKKSSVDFRDTGVKSINDRSVETIRQTVVVQLTIDVDFDQFGYWKKKKLMRELKKLLSPTPKIKFLEKRRGSTKVTIQISLEQAEQLFWLQKRGVLKEFGVVDAKVLEDEIVETLLQHKLMIKSYDVFMCHNSEDKPEIKRIAVRLRRYGILPWIVNGN